VLEIYTLEALKGRLLVGPYSRFGWHHPGPLYFYLEAPWYWLSGRHTAGMQAGALVLNAAAVAAIAWAVATSAGTPTGIALGGGVAWYLWRTGDLIVSPWNPHVVVLPMLAYIVLAAWFAATGRRTLLPPLVLLASFLAQTHIAMAPPVVLVMLVAGVVQRDAMRDRWPSVMVIALIAWLPSIVEQVTHHPGNLTRIVRFFAGAPAGQPAMTAAAAWSAALTGAFRPGFRVAMGIDVRPLDSLWPLTWSVAQMGLLIAAAVRARARRAGFAMWLAVMSGLTGAVALAAVTRIRGQIVDHEVFWISAVGVATAAAIAGGLDCPRRRSRNPAAAAATMLVVTATLIGCTGVWHVLERRRTTDDHAVDVLATSLERYIAVAHVRRPVIHIEQQIWPIAAGALLLVHKNGISFAVDDQWTTMFGERFEADGREDADVTITGSARQPRIVTKP
jgi:hypothetical protein